MELLRELNRETWGGKNLVTVGEAWGADIPRARQYSAPDGSVFSMVFQFEQMCLDHEADKWVPQSHGPARAEGQHRPLAAGAARLRLEQPVLDNHDLPRIVSRWGDDGACRADSAKALAVALHGLQGTPYIYQGEELGMTNAPYPVEELRDLESINAYNEMVERGMSESDALAAIHRMMRDNARTPMQWTAGPHAGFTDGDPWMMVNPNYTEINAAAALADPDSVFYTYQKLIALRKAHRVFAEGDFTLLCPEDEQVFAYLRRGAGQEMLVAVNLSGRSAPFALPEALCGPRAPAGHPGRPPGRGPAPLGGADLPARSVKPSGAPLPGTPPVTREKEVTPYGNQRNQAEAGGAHHRALACQPDACTDAQLYHALLALTQQLAAGRPAPAGERKLYYFSAEFLMGKLLSNNLLALGLFGPVRALLDEMGRSLAALEEYEPEPSLGNGGLGRLAACFLDSIAALDLPGDGVGLNYHYGLFHQKFVDRRQQEQPDPWIEPESWLLPTGKTYTVPFGGFALDAVLYDIAVPGAHSEVANRLHLFDVADPAQPPAHGIDFDKRDIPHCLTSFLYPDDSDRDGQLLRVYQQYFMVSAGAQLILDELAARGFGPDAPQRARGHPDQRHPPLHGHPRADPPADREGPDLRRRSGTGGKDLRLHQPHHPGRGPGKVAPGLYPDGGPPRSCPSSRSWTAGPASAAATAEWPSWTREAGCTWPTWTSTTATR